MIKIINGIEYTSIDIGGKPSNYIVSKNLSSREKFVHIEHEIDGVPVLSIKDNAFMKCIWLNEVELPDSLFRIGRAAFYNCAFLMKVRFYKTSAENSESSISIGQEAFSGCISLTEIDTMKPLHLNGQMIFHNCIALQKLNNGNVLVGGVYALDFYNCKSLKHIYIKGSRCRLWTDCFKDAVELCDIRFDCNYVQAPKTVLKQIAKKKIHCNSKCNLTELAYTGTNIYITD